MVPGPHCYSFFDVIFPACGLRDLTEGMYFGDPSVSYEQAQRNQIEWLLDEVRCRAGSRILDIGCGPGVQTVELLRLSGGTVVALDFLPQMIARVEEGAAIAGRTSRTAGALLRLGMVIGNGGCGPITRKLQDAYFGLFNGQTEDKWGWLEPID